MIDDFFNIYFNFFFKNQDDEILYFNQALIHPFIYGFFSIHSC